MLVPVTYYGVLLKFVIPILVKNAHEQQARYEDLNVILHTS